VGRRGRDGRRGRPGRIAGSPRDRKRRFGVKNKASLLGLAPCAARLNTEWASPHTKSQIVNRRDDQARRGVINYAKRTQLGRDGMSCKCFHIQYLYVECPVLGAGGEANLGGRIGHDLRSQILGCRCRSTERRVTGDGWRQTKPIWAVFG